MKLSVCQLIFFLPFSLLRDENYIYHNIASETLDAVSIVFLNLLKRELATFLKLVTMYF